jgi:hypothetical protein
MGFGVAEVSSFVRLSSSGVVGDSGKAVDIIGYTIKSGATAAAPSFLNGAATTAALGWVDQARAVSAEQSIALAYPIRCPLGCYVSFDANTTAITVFYRQMIST